MNRYQLEVAEFDRQHRLKVRAISFVAAALVTIAALWSAGFPPSLWWGTIASIFESNSPTSEVGMSIPSPAIPAPIPSPDDDRPIREYPGTQSSISETPLPLVLVSTQLGRHSREGFALIGTDPRNPQRYAAGATLVNDARLEEIFSDHVMLVRGDKRVRLDIGTSVQDRGKTRNHDVLHVGSQQVAQVTLAERKKARITDVILYAPSYENGVMAGVTVYPGKRRDVFSGLGLQTRDVILTANGLPLTDATTARGLFDSLLDGSTISAVVSRGSATASVFIDGDVIAKALEPKEADALLAGPSMTPPAGIERQ